MTPDLEDLIEELESSPDDEGRDRVFRAVTAVLDFQREAFRRVLAVLRDSGREDLVTRLLEDPLLESVLRGYRLVEVDLEMKVRAFLGRLGVANRVRLLGVQSGVARLEATADPASWLALKRQVEPLLRSEIPELVGLTFARRDAMLPTLAATEQRAAEPVWLPLMHWWELEREGRQTVAFFEDELVVCAVGGRAYVFRNRCPVGGEGLDDATLEATVLTCRTHGRFDLQTGVGLDEPRAVLHLLPVRLQDGVVQVDSRRGEA